MRTKECRILVEASRAGEQARADVTNRSDGAETGRNHFARTRGGVGSGYLIRVTNRRLAHKLARRISEIVEPTGGALGKHTGLSAEHVIE